MAASNALFPKLIYLYSNLKTGNDTSVQMMTMLLMTVDGRIGILYNEILGQLDEEKRKKATDELKSLKEISTALNDAISKMLAFENKTPGKSLGLNKSSIHV